MATKNASAALVSPETKSPAIVSRIAFVIASPGTKSIIPPIISVSRLDPKPRELNISDIKAAIAPPIQFIKKPSMLS